MTPEARDPHAYEIRDGGVVPCEYVGLMRCVWLPPPPMPFRFISPSKRTPRERRKAARAGLRGRRGARRVSSFAPPPLPSSFISETRLDRAHAYRWRLETIFLYLPADETPTEEHLRMMTGIIRRKGHGYVT